MVPISQLSDRKLTRAEDEVQIGQEVTVMVVNVDNGKISLSRKAVLGRKAVEVAIERARRIFDNDQDTNLKTKSHKKAN